MGRPRTVINKENAELREIEVAMDCTPSKRIYLRLQAIFYLYQGESWELVVKLSRTSERQVLRWVHLFNARGIDGLIPRHSSGRPRKVSNKDFTEKVLPVVREPTRAEQTHWTAVKLHGWLRTELKSELSYSTLLRYLHEQDFRLKVPRPWPERQDEQLRQAFVAELKELQNDPAVELWFTDECGVEGDPRPRRRWAHKSDRIKVPYLGDHIRQSVIGAVCPQTGQCHTIIFDYCDTEVFQLFLDTLAKAIPADPAKKRYLIMDNASWHRVKSLNWHHFQPKYLPPYSPDLNPIERLWLRLKADFFADYIAKTRDTLIDRLSTALRHFFDHPSANISLCKIKNSL